MSERVIKKRVKRSILFTLSLFHPFTLYYMQTTRRNALKTLTGSALTLTTLETLASGMENQTKLKGNIRHSVSRWCYGSIPLEELCQACKEIGIESIELTGPEEWPILNKYGLTAAMGQGSWPKGTGLPNFFNNAKNHDTLTEFYTALIPQAANAGVRNIICFSGNRNGQGDYPGLLSCQKVLQRLMPIAEKNNVTLTMELLSSRHSHPDYQCDNVGVGSSAMRNGRVSELQVIIRYFPYAKHAR